MPAGVPFGGRRPPRPSSREAREAQVKQSGLLLIGIVGAATILLFGQEIPDAAKTEKVESFFLRLTVYPTASLSRYDYNNDVDRYEIRTYAELRESSHEGDIVRDARIAVQGETLEFKDGQYEKRILVEKDKLPESLSVKIVRAGVPLLDREFPLPYWLVLTEPKPAVIDPGMDLRIAWTFLGRFSTPVDIEVYDFRRGDRIAGAHDHASQEMIVPAKNIPPSTILRIYILPSWLSKRFLRGQNLARGSEIIIIPWSQVFIRTKESDQETGR